MRRLNLRVLAVAAIGIIAALIVTGCDANIGTADSTPVPTVIAASAVIAQGRLQPKQFTEISYNTNGNIAELLVTEGQAVQIGDVIARLKNSEQLQADVARVEKELIDAKQAFTELKNDAGVLVAQAEADLPIAKKEFVDAQRAFNNLEHPNVAAYEKKVREAEAALLKAQENQTLTDIGSLNAQLKSARDEVKRVNELLGKIKAAVDGCRCGPNDSVQVDDLPSMTLKQAQDDYNGALNAVKALEIQIAQATRDNQKAIEESQKELTKAKRNLQFVLSGPNPIELAKAGARVSLARAKLAKVEAYLTKVQTAGADPEKMESAQTRIASAEAALKAAQAALADLELRAPIGGVITDVKIKVGERVGAGQPAVTIANFSDWVVKTNDLTEIDPVG